MLMNVRVWFSDDTSRLIQNVVKILQDGESIRFYMQDGHYYAYGKLMDKFEVTIYRKERD